MGVMSGKVAEAILEVLALRLSRTAAVVRFAVCLPLEEELALAAIATIMPVTAPIMPTRLGEKNGLREAIITLDRLALKNLRIIRHIVPTTTIALHNIASAAPTTLNF